MTGDRHCRMTDVTVYRTGTLDPVAVSRTCRIPLTTPARTLLDLGGVVPPKWWSRRWRMR